MQCTFRSGLSALIAFSLVSSAVAPAGAAPAISRADYEACQSSDESAFHQAIASITVGALERGLAHFDYRSAVDTAWREAGLDELVAKRVDLAVSEVREETSWGGLIKSLADQEKAQELALAVAERVYQSEAMRTAIETLAVGVGKQIGRQIELASEDAAGPAVECLKAFLGPRYGSAVAAAVSGDADREFGVDPSKAGAEVGPGAVLEQSGEGITGAAILIMRRQLANMAQRIGQRLAGSVLSRLVSVVAGGVGLVLIAKDVWDLRHGVLPIIAEEMKSKETKDKVKEELAKSISEQIGTHVRDIGEKSADRVVLIWQEFRRAHAKALDLADRDAGFKQLLDSLAVRELARLDEVVALLLAEGGESGVRQRIGDGTLEEAVKRLPEAGMEIARETRSIAIALKWNATAGDALPQVVVYELHRRAKPDELTRASLTRILGLGDRLAITRVAGISREARDTLFELEAPRLAGLARTLSETELAALAGYLSGLGKEPRQRVLDAVAAEPARMQMLAKERVRDAVITSADQSAAIDIMLRGAGTSAPDVILQDVKLAWEGRIHPLLIWERHTVAVLAAAALGLALLLILRRLVFPRRRHDPAASGA